MGILFVIIFWVGIGLLYRLSRDYLEPHIKFSRLSDLKRKGSPALLDLPNGLFLGSLILFSIAMTDPYIWQEKEGSRHLSQVEGVAIYLVLDRSGSMQEELIVWREDGRSQKSKMEILKEVTGRFVEGRENDLIGLIAFARAANVISPLTLDHNLILKELDGLDWVKDEQQDGTALGYAVYKTAGIIGATKQFAKQRDPGGREGYQIKNAVMVVVTDGIQNPSGLDAPDSLRHLELIEGARLAKEVGARLYLVSVDPRITTREFQAHRTLMQQAVEETGGRLFLLQSPEELDAVYEEIDQLEKSALPEKEPDRYQKHSFSPYLIMVGICFIGLSQLLQLTWFRRVP
ncbi:MAG: VWA domain-containing protein [Waddliaceae bacterium]